MDNHWECDILEWLLDKLRRRYIFMDCFDYQLHNLNRRVHNFTNKTSQSPIIRHQNHNPNNKPDPQHLHPIMILLLAMFNIT